MFPQGGGIGYMLLVAREKLRFGTQTLCVADGSSMMYILGITLVCAGCVSLLQNTR